MKKVTAELQKKLKAFLEKEERKLEKQIKELKKDDPFTDPDHVIDNAAVDTDVREQIGHEIVEAEIKELTKRLENIVRALSKIKRGTYGKCDRCRKVIRIERLKLLPEARYCIDCERKLRS